VKGILIVVVVVVDRLGNQVAGGAGRDERHVQPRRPRFDGEHHLADIAADHGDDFVLAHGALESAHRVGRGGMIVIGNDFDLATVDAAAGVDVVGGHGGGLGQRRAGNRGFLADHADSDRLGILCARAERRHSDRKDRTSEQPPTGAACGAWHRPIPPRCRGMRVLPRSETSPQLCRQDTGTIKV
jgi:hypothetical protein